MPWTLYRYIFFDLFKLTLLASVVLCTVVAIALAIRPLAEGLLSPLDLLRFVLFSTPTLLGFVLPFAGAFASTMVFCRLTADNEILAASVGGLSYRAILVPVLALGIGVGSGLWVLSNWVMPYFYRSAAALVQRDVASLLVRQIARNEPVSMGGYVIYADRAVERDRIPHRDEAHRPTQWIMLDGLVVGRFDASSGELRSEYTAAQANLLFYEIAGQPWLTVQLRDAEMYRPSRGEIAFGEEVPLQWAIEQPYRDRPQFYTPRQLAQIKQEPYRYSAVADRHRELVQALAAEKLLQTLAHHLERGILRLDSRPQAVAAIAAESPTGDARWPQSRVHYRLRAPQFEREGQRLILHGDEQTPVRIDQHRDGTLERQWFTHEALLDVSHGLPGREPHIELRLLKHVRVIDWPTGFETPQRATILGSARWAEPLLPRLEARATTQLLELARTDYAHSETVTRAARSLEHRIHRLTLRIGSLQHTRAALAVAGMMVLVLGAVLAMNARGRTPLVVYLGSFLMALLTIVLVKGGENYADDTDLSNPQLVGLPIIWSGNALLLGAIALSYRRLARN